MSRFFIWKADLAANVRMFIDTRWTFTGITLGQYGFGVIRRHKGTTTGVIMPTVHLVKDHPEPLENTEKP